MKTLVWIRALNGRYEAQLATPDGDGGYKDFETLDLSGVSPRGDDSAVTDKQLAKALAIVSGLPAEVTHLAPEGREVTYVGLWANGMCEAMAGQKQLALGVEDFDLLRDAFDEVRAALAAK